MKTRNILAAVAMIAATATGSAFADQTYPTVDFVGHQSNASSAQVQGELQQAQADGNYVVGGTESVNPAAGFTGTKTRAQVVAELEQAQQNPDFVVGGNEFTDPAAGFTSTKTRAQVLAELQQSQPEATRIASK